MPSIKTTSTTSSNSSDDQLPLGQRPEGDDQFENALVKLEDAFNRLMSSINLLQKNIEELKIKNEKLEEQVASMVPFNNLSVSYKDPLVLTPDMEVKDGHK
jgi:TolA-binding protein